MAISRLRLRPCGDTQHWGKKSHSLPSAHFNGLGDQGGGICDTPSDIPPSWFATPSGTPRVKEYENYVLFKNWTVLDSEYEPREMLDWDNTRVSNLEDPRLKGRHSN